EKRFDPFTSPERQRGAGPSLAPGAGCRTASNRHWDALSRATFVPAGMPVRSHTFTVSSLLALASVLPSGENRTQKTRSLCPSMTARCWYVCASYSRTAPLRLPVAISRPSALKLTARTCAGCGCWIVAFSLPVAVSHSFTVPSALAEASVLPSGAKAHVQMMLAWPVNVMRRLPVSASHSLSCRSRPAVATVFSSGENAAKCTSSVWPVKVTFSWPVATSHSFAVLSPLAVSSVLPSAEKTAVRTLSAWPWSVLRSLHVATSQSMTLLSTLAVASVLPSREKAANVTTLAWARR